MSALEQAALHDAMVETIDAMLADPEPRTAIIGAYARLLHSLADAGIGRHEHEAPLEHLRRALTRARVRPAPLRELIALFEIARFSSHPLSAAHREQALAALHAAATDLAAARAKTVDTDPVGAPR
jgi:hypothetical protein